MRVIFPFVAILVCVLPARHGTSQEIPEELLTVAEKSGWRATEHHADVVELMNRLDAASELAHVETAGTTSEGRSIPILVIADPPVENPNETGGRLTVFAWGGIHSGEVCGKPATLMLARELVTTPNHPLLKDLVVLLLPLLNADGNERMSPDNRPGQDGPVEGMGIRANAMGLNINRDFTKLDAPETRAVLHVLNRWDPAVAIDLHTTNGSRHRYVLTYDGHRHPASDDPLRALTKDKLLPWVTAEVRKNTGYEMFFYGNFDRTRTKWLIDDAMPRYSTHYLGLRHHMGILSEAYSYATYQDRVIASREFVRHCFQFVAVHKDDVRRIRDEAKRRTVELGNQPVEGNLVALRRESRLSDKPIEILGYDNPSPRGEAGEPKTYSVSSNDLNVATLSVPRPYAYIVPARLENVLDRLRAHGIEIGSLPQEGPIDVEVYRVESVRRLFEQRVYEGHSPVAVDVTVRREQKTLSAGTPIVRTGQPLGTLAAYLLEPQSEDGFCTWNFLDDDLAVGNDLPILRVPAVMDLETAVR